MLFPEYGVLPTRHDPRVTVVTDPAALPGWHALLKRLSLEDMLVWDTETSGFEYFKEARIIGHVFGYDLGDGAGPRGVYFPIRHATYEPQLPVEWVTWMVQDILGDPRATICGWNLKFDLNFAAADGIVVRAKIHDGMIMVSLIDENRPKEMESCAYDWGIDEHAYEMKTIVQRLLTEECRRRGVKKRQAPGFTWIPISILGRYACKDGYNTFGLAKRLLPLIQAHWANLYATEMKLTRYLQRAEFEGTPIDIPYLQGVHILAEQRADQLEREIHRLAGFQLKVSSDQELRRYLYDHLKFTPTHFTKHGQPNPYGNTAAERAGTPAVDERAIKAMIRQNRHGTTDLLRTLLGWREQDKILSTYTLPIIKRCDARGYLHTSLNQVKTNTGRLSSSEPNLQNIPTDDTAGIRKAFLVPAGHTRIYIDFSQVELRVLAHYSKDPTMVAAFVNKEDIHTRTSLELFASKEKKHRRIAKVINFGLCIAEGQRVLTDAGLVPIEHVKDWHKVWDGVEWVNHGGLVCRGRCEVMTYGGVTATPDHKVYLEDGSCVSLRQASSAVHGRRLAVGELAGSPVGYAVPDRQGRKEGALAAVHRSKLLAVRAEALAARRQREIQENYRLRLQGAQVSGRAGVGRVDARATLRRYGATLRAGYACFIGALQGARSPSALRVAGAFHSLGVGEVALAELQGFGVRSSGQRWELLPRESAADDAVGERSQRTALVYDLINAGPRHRYTVEGVVVSNSYGMSAIGVMENLNATADPSAGIDYVTEEQAQSYLDRFHARYPRVMGFCEELWQEMRRQRGVPQFTNVFGRTRRLPELANVGRGGRRAERQAVASIIQGTAADIAKESMVRVGERLDEARAAGRYNGSFKLTVHDENQMDVETSGALVAAAELKRDMEFFPQFAPIDITAEAEWSTTTWADKKEIWSKE